MTNAIGVCVFSWVPCTDHKTRKHKKNVNITLKLSPTNIIYNLKLFYYIIFNNIFLTFNNKRYSNILNDLPITWISNKELYPTDLPSTSLRFPKINSAAIPTITFYRKCHTFSQMLSPRLTHHNILGKHKIEMCAK